MFKDLYVSVSIVFLLVLSISILNSIAPNLFPLYFIYTILALASFWVFSQISFEVVKLFSVHFYVISIFLLIITFVIGQVTHGTLRWIPLGPFSLQPSELVRPFLLIFFASYLTNQKVNLKRFLVAVVLLAIPILLILIQPSLGVSILTLVGFLGVLMASEFNKKYLLVGALVIAVLIPIFWQVMAPYQKQRLTTFLQPDSDPLGAGYNTIQSTIATGAGKLFGRGLGKGIQTQLSFLPEKQTDFIFSAVGEELGFIGAGLILIATFMILFRLTKFMENSTSFTGRAYLSGFFLTYVIQVSVHVGMNMGIFPVTGLPFPLVSAGGSSLLATMTALGIALGAYKK